MANRRFGIYKEVKLPSIPSAVEDKLTFDHVFQNILSTNFCVFTKLILPIFTYSDLKLFQSISKEGEIYLYQPTYGPQV